MIQDMQHVYILYFYVHLLLSCHQQGGIYISSPYARHVKVPVTCPGILWLNLELPNHWYICQIKQKPGWKQYIISSPVFTNFYKLPNGTWYNIYCKILEISWYRAFPVILSLLPFLQVIWFESLFYGLLPNILPNTGNSVPLYHTICHNCLFYRGLQHFSI